MLLAAVVAAAVHSEVYISEELLYMRSVGAGKQRVHDHPPGPSW